MKDKTKYIHITIMVLRFVVAKILKTKSKEEKDAYFKQFLHP